MRRTLWAGAGLLMGVWVWGFAALPGGTAAGQGAPADHRGSLGLPEADSFHQDPTIWVLSRADRSITVLDGATGSRVGRVDLGFRSDPWDLAYGNGFVWVGNAGGSLQQVDVSSRRVSATIAMEMDVTSVAAAAHGVYGVDHERSLLSRHDPVSGELLDVMDLPDRIHAAGAGPQATLLVLGDRQEVHAFQGKSTESAVFPGALGPGDMAYGFGSLWLYQMDQRLLRLDPLSGAVVAEIPDTNVDEWAAGPGRGISVGESRVWITSLETGEALAVDPATDRVTRRIPVGDYPEHAVELNGQLWVILPQEDLVARFDVATGEALGTSRVDFPSRILVVP